MSGHSKWANIKHRKARQDLKRAHSFTKIAKKIVAASKFGKDPEMNIRLKMMIDTAKSINMPKENIERAIKKGSGEDKDAKEVEEIIYEIYGPSQIGVLIKVLTDNRNRTLGEIKNILKKHRAKLGESGSVSWQFEAVGKLLVKKDLSDKVNVEEKILLTSACDYKELEEDFLIFSAPEELQKVGEELKNHQLKVVEASLGFRAKDKMKILEDKVLEYQKFINELEEQEDIVDIWDNLQI